MRPALLTACLTSIAPAAGLGQELRYSAEPLRCAVFEERVESQLRGSGSSAERATTHREGTMVVQVGDSSGVLQLTAWYDTLTIRRDTERGREIPDASGVWGGRFRGRLDPSGAYTRFAAPFVPDELRAVVDLSTALSDFFPRLPDTVLAVGGRWRREGHSIEREKPTQESIGMVERLTWTLRKQSRDTVEIAGRTVMTIQTIEERGRLRWSPRLGPVGWIREIDVTVEIPTQPNVKKGYRTRLRQRVTVDRSFGSPLC